MKLSNDDKCWIIANLEKTITPFSLIIGLMPVIIYQEHKNELPSFLGVTGIAGTTLLILIAIYVLRLANRISNFADKNFESVISKSTKWRKSKVELHEMRYRYTMERFGLVFITIYGPIFSLIWILIYYFNYA
jgi:hypothetical protein